MRGSTERCLGNHRGIPSKGEHRRAHTAEGRCLPTYMGPDTVVRRGGEWPMASVASLASTAARCI